MSFCRASFNYEKINTWVDDEKTAVCPHYSIDSIVPTEVNRGMAKYKITKEIRKKIKNIYFGG